MAKRTEQHKDLSQASDHIPPQWRESFACFSDDSLHLLARLYLSGKGAQAKTHSRELIMEALWHHARRHEFSRASLKGLNSFDTQLLLLLYLGLQSVQQLAGSMPQYSCIEICLQLLHLQERLLVLRLPQDSARALQCAEQSSVASTKNAFRAVKPAKSVGSTNDAPEALVHLIPKVEKHIENPDGAFFVIAPQFLAQLQEHLDFCTMFGGRSLPTPSLVSQSGQSALPHKFPALLLSSELLLAAALYFVQEAFSCKRKISKVQLARCRDCFPQLSGPQILQLWQLALDCGLIYEENAQQQVEFSVAALVRLWSAPCDQRLLALQAWLSGLHSQAFAKLLCLWPRNVMLAGSQLHRLLVLLGLSTTKGKKAKEDDGIAAVVQTMLEWNLLCRFDPTEGPGSDSAEACYLFNPQLYNRAPSSDDAGSDAGSGKARTDEAGSEDSPGSSNKKGIGRLSSNWELYCDLRHPKDYVDLLLCARLEQFDDLCLFRIKKNLFQRYFNAEQARFDRFMQGIPQLERCGLEISEFIRQQWQEWFYDSARFQLFKGCLLVCQPSYGELIRRVLDEATVEPEEQSENPVAQYAQPTDSDILCCPQPGVFYLNETRRAQWLKKLRSAGIQPSEPFSRSVCKTGELSGQAHPPMEQTDGQMERLQAAQYEAMPQIVSLEFPLSSLPQQVSVEAAQDEAEKQSALFADSPVDEPPRFAWDSWPTSPLSFVQSRQLVCANSDLSQLHIHFREARGLDYIAKRNLLHSLLTARNHMAIITVAEGDDFDLVPYTVLPLNLEGSKENPALLALELRQECLMRFCVKNITRVNEVFYSLINICLLSLLPCEYIFELESRFLRTQGPEARAEDS